MLGGREEGEFTMKKLLALVVALLGFYVAWPAYTGYEIHAALEADDADLLDRKIDFPQVRQSIREPVMVQIEDRIGQILGNIGAAIGVTADDVDMNRIGAIVDGALAEVIAPNRLGGIYRRGGDVTGEIQQAVLRQIEKSGGFASLLSKGTTGGDSSGSGVNVSIGGINISDGIGGLLNSGSSGNVLSDVAKQLGGSGGDLAGQLFPKSGAASNGTRSGRGAFGIANIKSFGFVGPLGMEVGIAKNGEAQAPDVTARMNFQDLDWKLTRLTPHFH